MNDSNEIKEELCEFLFITKPEVMNLEGEKKPSYRKKETLNLADNDFGGAGDDSNLPHFKKEQEYDPDNPNNYSIEEEDEDDEDDDEDSDEDMNEQPKPKDLNPADIKFDFDKFQQYVSSPLKSSFGNQQGTPMTVRNRESQVEILKVAKPGGDIHEEEILRRMSSTDMTKDLPLQDEKQDEEQKECDIVTHTNAHGIVTVQKEELVGLGEEDMKLVNSFYELIEQIDREKIEAEYYPFDHASYQMNKQSCPINDVVWPEDVLFDVKKLDYSGEELVNFLKNWK